MKRFWIIWNPDYPAPPTKKFDCLADAIETATKMAEKFYPHTFNVMEVIGSAKARQRIDWKTVA